MVVSEKFESELLVERAKAQFLFGKGIIPRQMDKGTYQKSK